MGRTNPRFNNLIVELKAVLCGSGANVWQDATDRLEKPRHTHAEVDLGCIERYAQEDETAVVPGRMLGSGILQKNATVATMDFSSTARKKTEQVGDTATLERLAEQNPDEFDIRVIR